MISSEGGRSLHRLIAALGLTLAALFAMTGSAMASAESTTASGAGEGTVVSALATCPKDTRATGGGFATVEEPTVPPYILVFESRKINQNAWLVQGQITDPRQTGETRTLLSQVYCSPSAPKTQERSVTHASGNGLALWFGEPQCLQGRTAQAGGFSGDHPTAGGPPGFINHQVGSSFLLNKKIHHSTILTATPGITFTTYVYCAKKTAGKIFSSVGQTQNAANGAKVNVFSEPCRKGVPRAGGFNQPNASFSSPGWYSEFWISLMVGDRWWVSAIHHGIGNFTQLQSFVYCGFTDAAPRPNK